MNTLIFLILALAVGLDSTLINHLISASSGESHFAKFVLLHTMLSLFMATVIFFTELDSKERSKGFFSFFFFIPVFMPVFGFLILIMTYLFWKILRTPINALQYQPIEAYEINIDEHRAHSQYGSGGAIKRIFNEKLPDQVRTDALLAISYTENKNSNHILLESIKSSSNQVRLLAYSIINAQENALTKQITDLNNSLKDIHESKKRGLIFKYLGEAYWELSYKGLIEGKQKETMLKNALHYFEQAKAIRNDDGEIIYYMARLYLAQNQFEIAKTLLNKAMDLHISPDIIIPYLSEIYYHEGNYFAIRRLMNINKEFEYIPTLAEVMKMWRNQHAR
jgi:hypothetical protein